MKISTRIQQSEVNNIEFSMHFYRVADDEITVSEMSKVFIQLSVMSAGSKVIVL